MSIAETRPARLEISSVEDFIFKNREGLSRGRVANFVAEVRERGEMGTEKEDEGCMVDISRCASSI